ncbi:MAG: ABC transporter ATP-binding protein, partial [Phototrophicales bacterium]
MTTVTLDHVSKRFQQTSADGGRAVTALDNLSLKLHSGDILGVLGTSGSGKSTLLRLIAGLIEPDSGEVLYDGVPLRSIPMIERGIGMVFQ